MTDLESDKDMQLQTQPSCSTSNQEDDPYDDPEDHHHEPSQTGGVVPSKEHLEVLARVFGHTSFRPLQWTIIQSIIGAGRDNCVMMATGSGKSLCFQYPSAYVGGLTIVISPLISLMENQVLSLTKVGLSACLLGKAQTSQKRIINQILDDEFRLVYMTPEFCMGEGGKALIQQMLSKLSITLLAIDEAHCVSSWGHDFRFKYRDLGYLRDLLPNVPILAVTATATPNVVSDIIATLKLKNPQIICSDLDRPNLYFQVYSKAKVDAGGISSDLRRAMVRRNGKWQFPGCTIIYCLTRKRTEEIAELLQQHTIKCRPYHAGLPLNIRKRTHDQFIANELDVIVATIAFGMGIDKADVRNIVHYGASSSLENYYQEVGRAGRDGSPAQCVTFFDTSDFTFHRTMRDNTYGSVSTKNHKEDLAERMKKYLFATTCRRRILLKYFAGRNDNDDDNDSFVANINCCDNCTNMRQSLGVLHGKYEGVDEQGLYNFASDAHRLLAAIDVLGGKHGITTYILFLRGSNCNRIDRFTRHILHGSGKNQSADWWKYLAALLSDGKYLDSQHHRISMRSYYTVSLSGKGESFLRSIQINPETKLMLRPSPNLLKLMKTKPQKQSGWLSKQNTFNNTYNNTMKVAAKAAAALTVSTTTKVTENDSAISEVKQNLYKMLLNKRNELARNHQCEPFTVASNTALMKMSREKPTTLECLRDCKLDGFNEPKLDRFGWDFLEVIRLHCNDDNLATTQQPKTIREILRKSPLPGSAYTYLQGCEAAYFLFRKRLSLNEIGTQMYGKSVDEVLALLIRCIRDGFPLKMNELGVMKERLMIILHAIDLTHSGFHTAIIEMCPPDVRQQDIDIVMAYVSVRKHLHALQVSYIEFEDYDYNQLIAEANSKFRDKDLNSRLTVFLEICNELLEADKANKNIIDNSSDSTTIDLNDRDNKVVELFPDPPTMNNNYCEMITRAEDNEEKPPPEKKIKIVTNQVDSIGSFDQKLVDVSNSSKVNNIEDNNQGLSTNKVVIKKRSLPPWLSKS